jgi:hypothetical protein
MFSAESQWPFDDPPETRVGVSRGILDNGDAIHCVEHDQRGDIKWYFWGSPLPPDLGRFRPTEISLGQIVELHSSIVQFADLPQGWLASAFHLPARCSGES